MPRLARILVPLALLFGSIALAQDIIQEIRVTGNRRVATESIRFRIGSKEGEPLDPRQVTRDVRALWQTGLFDDLGATVINGENGKILMYVVRELPLIVETEIRGNRKLTKSSITDKIEEERLTIPENAPLDYSKVNAIRVLIKDMLNERGLRYGTVDYILESVDLTSARIVFDINEGSKVQIYEIEFTGNDIFTDRQLRRTMSKIKEHWMFSWLTTHDIFKQEGFDEDVEKIKKRYWKKGFKDIYVGEPTMEITDHTSEKQKRKNLKREAKNKPARKDLRMKLTIPVFEGQGYAMGEFLVDGNTVLPETLYTNSFPLAKGDVYDLGKINEWIEELEEMHNNAGYVHYSIDQDFKVREGNVVDVTFKVKENDQVYVHRIGFSGNTTTRDKVLRREVLLREGDVFRLNFFRNSLLRINQLGFFDVTHDEPDVKFLPEENKVNVTVNGQESGVNELNFGLGFNEYRGTSGFLSFSTLNFMGRGEQVQVKAQLGSITDTFDVTYSVPWLFDKPRGLSARVFNTRSRFETSGFDLESNGFQVGMSFRPSVFTTYTVSYLFSEDRFPTISSPEFKPVDDLLTSSITQTIAYNTTDHPFFPSSGRKASFSVELAGWQGGGDNYFYKLRSSYVQYLPAIKKTFIGFNISGAYLDTLEGQRPTAHQLFFSGGEESVRGYERQSLGPIVEDTNGRPVAVRGDKLAQFNFEYIIPVSEQFRFVMFYDTGMVFGTSEDWFDTDLARSVGVEMRFSLPVFQAPMRLIWAYKLDENELNEKGGEPKFSIGTTF